MLVARAQSRAGARAAGHRAHHRAHLQAQQRASLAEATRRDLELNQARSVILALGLLVFATGFLSIVQNGPRLRRLRKISLLLLALLALTSYYNFFRYVHVGGLRTTDNFHYYIGSKYFEELGYFGLYECALQASRAGRGRPIPPGQTARDLRSMQLRPVAHVLAAGAHCPQRFTPARWNDFVADVRYFTRAWPEDMWRRVWNDYGYHPSPIWTWLGGTVSKHAPLDVPWLRYALARMDRAIVVVGLLAIFWTFGLEVASLCALFLGTGFLWRYAFVGDAFLRFLWWTSMVFGLCALRRRRFARAGGWLCLSSGLRLFPAVIPLAYTMEALARFRRARARDDEFMRFMGAALVTGLALLLLALEGNGRGISAFSDFAEKISAFARIGATNKMGLSVAAEALASATGIPALLTRIGVLVAFGGLAWRARRAIGFFEAAALGTVAIPLFTSPTNYYYTFLVAPLLLAERRPAVGLWILGGCLGFNLNGMIFHRQYAEYWTASWIALAILAGVLFELGRSRPIRRVRAPHLPEPGTAAAHPRELPGRTVISCISHVFMCAITSSPKRSMPSSFFSSESSGAP